MGLIEEFLIWVANFQLLGNHANILGFLWLITLSLFLYSRFRKLFQKCYALRCSECNFSYLCCPKTERKWVWHILVFALSAYAVFFFQMVLDDAITTPINLLFGSWEMREPILGSFSVFNLILTKWDVYAMIFLFALVFYVKGIYQFFKFTKASLFWLILVVAFSLIIANTHWWTHLRYEGLDRAIVFWLSYPEFRILTGFFIASITKKPRAPS